MTLRRDDDRPRRQPPKQKWVIPLIVGIAVAIFAFVIVELVVSGQSFF